MYNRLPKMMLPLASVVILLYLLKGVTASQDLTENENVTGSDVVRATIATLDHVFRNTTFWDISHSTFMRTLAYIETKDGLHDPEMAGIQWGIWGVNQFSLNDARNRIGRSSIIFREIESRLGEGQWAAITDDDNLNKPIYSAIGARLILIASHMISGDNRCDLSSFSTFNISMENLAHFWLTCYRLHTGDNDVDLIKFFIRRNEEFQRLPENECNIGTDLAFVLDSSGSIGADNWDLVKDYVKDVTSTIDIEGGDQRVAIITYSSTASIITDFTNDQGLLEDTVNDLRFLGRSTGTADGLCRLLDLNWRENVLRFAIVVTDGRSNRDSTICGNLSQAINVVNEQIRPALTISVIGVTDDVDPEELREIASSDDFHELDTLQNSDELTNIMGQQTYQICFSASAPIDIGIKLMGDNFTPNSTARYSYTYQKEGVTIRLCVQNGSVILYASLTIPNPNRALNDFALDAVLHGDICEDVFVDPSSMMMPDVDQNGRRKRQVSSSEGTLFVSIEGIAESSTFTLETTVGDTANYTVTCAQAICGRNSDCTDDPVGYSCVCLPGYVFGPDLIDCHDINECERFPSPCSQFANCTNTNGSHECYCHPTHIGDGATCKLNENSEPKLILIIACSAGGGVIVLVVLLAAVISIYKTMTASKNSPYHERGNNPAPSDLNADSKDSDTVHLTENMLY